MDVMGNTDDADDVEDAEDDGNAKNAGGARRYTDRGITLHCKRKTWSKSRHAQRMLKGEPQTTRAQTLT